MAFEMSITVKNEEKRQTTKHLVYDTCTVSDDDPIIQGHIEAAVKEFNAEPDDIKIKIILEVK
jgi:hypothetical protein